MSLSIIVAKASNNAIGKDNALLWHLSDDLKRFKKLTMGHPIIMGRKTFESLPGVLPGRVHYVLTGNKDYKAPEGVLLFHDVKSLMESLPEGENFVIGGEHMYKALLPYAGALYITEVEKPFDGDAFFPGDPSRRLGRHRRNRRRRKHPAPLHHLPQEIKIVE